MPNCRVRSGSWAEMALETLTVFASEFLVTVTARAVWPFTREMLVVSTGCSFTVATSLNITGPSVPCSINLEISSAVE